MSYSPEKLNHSDKSFGAEGNSTLYVGFILLFYKKVLIMLYCVV